MEIKRSELDRHITGNYGENQFSEYTFKIDGYITADINADEWLDAFLEWMENHNWIFGGIIDEAELGPTDA